MLSILIPKVTYNNFCCPIPAYHILKTGIVTNEIYIKRLSTTTRMYSCS